MRIYKKPSIFMKLSKTAVSEITFILKSWTPLSSWEDVRGSKKTRKYSSNLSDNLATELTRVKTFFSVKN